VECPRTQLFPGAGFAGKEQAGIGGRHQRELALYCEEGRIFADKLIEDQGLRLRSVDPDALVIVFPR
jgi:hypothetical protein